MNNNLINLITALKSENANEWSIAYNYGAFMAAVKADNDAAEKDAKKRDGDEEINAAAAAENVSLDAFGKNRRSKYRRVFAYGKLAENAPHMSAYPVGSVSALFELITAVKISKDDDAAAADKKISAFIAENDITAQTGALAIRAAVKKAAERAAAAQNAAENAQTRRFTAVDAEKIEKSEVYAALFKLHSTIAENAAALKAFNDVTALVCPRYAEVEKMAAERAAAERAAAAAECDNLCAAFSDKFTAAENAAENAAAALMALNSAAERAAAAQNAAENAQNVSEYKHLSAAAAAERMSADTLKGIYENARAAAENARAAAVDAGDAFDAAVDRLSA